MLKLIVCKKKYIMLVIFVYSLKTKKPPTSLFELACQFNSNCYEMKPSKFSISIHGPDINETNWWKKNLKK